MRPTLNTVECVTCSNCGGDTGIQESIDTLFFIEDHYCMKCSEDALIPIEEDSKEEEPITVRAPSGYPQPYMRKRTILPPLPLPVRRMA